MFLSFECLVMDWRSEFSISNLVFKSITDSFAGVCFYLSSYDIIIHIVDKSSLT